MFKIKLENLNKLLEFIAKSYDLFLPCKKANETNFEMFTSSCDFDFQSTKTVKSIKEIFFPQVHNLSKFIVRNKEIKVVNEDDNLKPFVIFGARQCDFKSLEILDKVFLAEPVDTDYKNRRDNGIVLTNVCLNPTRSCFCQNYNIDPLNTSGDIETIIVESYMLFKVNTQKGELLLKNIENMLEKATETDIQKVEETKQKARQIHDKLPYNNLPIDKIKNLTQEEMFNSEVFSKLSKSCLGCGSCTFVCPTCQCYDIRDFKSGDKVIRYRCWDSCMYSDFTMMAGGNPRKTQMQRYRQRFMHKLKYYPDNNNGIISCVGCGRCIDKCPSNLHIVKVIKGLGEK